ncbi:MAG: hypothetical protein AAF942_02645 [Pseudomonadota bacterium]
MPDFYVHHRVTAQPREWNSVAEKLRASADEQFSERGGALYGVWRSQIGRPRDELAVVTVWPDEESASDAETMLLDGLGNVVGCSSECMVPTLRPQSTTPPRRQGNYAFRWFKTPPANWDEFLALCEAAWPGFESAYDSQVVGLWRFLDEGEGLRKSLLMTRRPDLAMWERSKIPSGEAEAEVRRQLSRRYDLCDWTCVHTTTLIGADDLDDTVRWA